jgi:hypothetical protein
MFVTTYATAETFASFASPLFNVTMYCLRTGDVTGTVKYPFPQTLEAWATPLLAQGYELCYNPATKQVGLRKGNNLMVPTFEA